jgi:Na+-driven multidrug efflux pump
MMDIFSAYLRGIKHPIAPTIVTIVCACAMRFLWVYCFFDRIQGMHTLLWLYAAYPITWTIADLTYLTIIPRFTKQAYSEIDARLSLASRDTKNTSLQPSPK